MTNKETKAQDNEGNALLQAFTQFVSSIGLHLAYLGSGILGLAAIGAAFVQFSYGYTIFSSDKTAFSAGLYKITSGLELIFLAFIPLLLIRAISKAIFENSQHELSHLKVSVAALLSAIIAASLTGSILQSPEEYIVIATKVGALLAASLYTLLMSISLKRIE